MRNKILEFLKDEGGQTSTEYILLVAVVALIVIKFGGKLQERLTGMTGKVFDTADTQIETMMNSNGP